MRQLSASFERDEAYRAYVLKRMWYIIPLALLFFYVSSIYSFSLFLLVFSVFGFTSSTSGWMISGLLGICAVFWFGSLLLQIYLLFLWLYTRANRLASPRDDHKDVLKLWNFVAIPVWISLLVFGTWWPSYIMAGYFLSREQFSISSEEKASAFEPNASIRRYREDIEKVVQAQATARELAELKARRMRGTILVRVQILSDGSLEKAEIIRPSDDNAINDAACRLINKAAPFPAFPPEMNELKNIVIVRKMTFNFSKSSPALVSTRPPGRQC